MLHASFNFPYVTSSALNRILGSEKGEQRGKERGEGRRMEEMGEREHIIRKFRVVIVLRMLGGTDLNQGKQTIEGNSIQGTKFFYLKA